jgi:hypothetical protein
LPLKRNKGSLSLYSDEEHEENSGKHSGNLDDDDDDNSAEAEHNAWVRER